MMLARVADSLYWIGRYAERAEHMSRVAEVMLNATLDDNKAAQSITAIATAAVGAPAGELGRDPYEAALAVTLNRNDAGSILWCVGRARENARQVRDQMTAETWERLNLMHLRLAAGDARKEFVANSSQFLQDIIADLHLFKGATDSTMSHGEGWRFLVLGVHLERAQLIGRLLKVFFADARQGADYPALASLLRMSCALEPYLRAHTADLNPPTILQFLLFDEAFPRSIRFCTDQIEQHLSRLTRHAGAGANAGRLAGRMEARLQFADIETAEREAVNALVEQVLDDCEAIHAAVYEAFVEYPLELRLPA